VFGDMIKESLKTITDMDTREYMMIVPLVIMTILLGVYPALVLDIIGPSVDALLENVTSAQAAAHAAMALN
jgi:NADH-quinone oxidoreductase subunit M